MCVRCAMLVPWLMLVLLAGCQLPNTPVAQAPAPTTTLAPPSTLVPSATRAPSAIVRPSAAATMAATPTMVATTTPSKVPTLVATSIPISPTATLAPLSVAERNALFEEVWKTVRDQYVYTDYRGLDWNAVHAEFVPQVAAADSPEVFYALLHALIDRLGDDHSRFESPQEVAEEEGRFEGKLRYTGIGAIIRDVPEGGLITQIAPNGPAAQAGLQSRDVVLAVNGIPFTDTATFGPDGPTGVVRGVAGTVVRLTIRSFNSPLREVAVVRQAIPSDAFPSVQGSRLPNTRIALLTISTFDVERLDARVRAELERLIAEGPLDGIIIDVRDNGGGVISLMLNTLGLFIDGGSDGSSKGRDSTDPLTIPRGKALPQLANVPLVVLTSDDTVSAAEMFTAGLRNHGRTHVVGTHTAGNTESLSPYQLSDGSRLWLAETVYLRPDGTPNEGEGIQPDRVVDAEWWRFAPADDPQVLAAIEELRR